jgi:hypothetical protein
LNNTKTISNQNTKSRAELIAARIKCDEDLLFFTRFFYKELRGSKFIVNDHHIELANHFDNVNNYKTKLLNLNIPPRHSKTELAINFIARGIGMNQSSNWLYISASDELRAEASTRIRDIVAHPYFKIMYGLELKKDQNSKNLWRTTKGGGLKTATIFGQVTGFGAGQMTEAGFEKDTVDLIREFEGAQVWDDLNKTEDSEAGNANNSKVSRVIFNTLMSRENSYDTPIIHIQQRTGMTDATASLMEHYGLEDERIQFVIMPILKEDGYPLWAAKFPLEEILKIKNSPKTSHVFDSQYMQDPQPKEGLVYDLKYYDQLTNEAGAISLGAADIADSGTDHLSVPFGKLIGKKVYVHDAIYTQDSSRIVAQRLADSTKRYDVDRLIAETNNQGFTYITLINTLGAQNVWGVVSRGNKMSRIIAKSWIVNEHFVFAKTGSKEYMAFLNRLKKTLKTDTKEDDAADSISIFAHYVHENYRHIFDNN